MAQSGTERKAESTGAIDRLTAWNIKNLAHGFCGRAGGVSAGRYASFNLAEWVGDEPAAVDENWRRWRAEFSLRRVARLAQVHGNAVRLIDSAYDGRRHKGDGMVVAEPGIALAIFTADCVPILMVDAERRIAGAFHAGWRGTLANIAEAGVVAMVAAGARLKSLSAAMGPSIGICCFEVDVELADEFARKIQGAREHSRPGRLGKAYLDLRAIIRGQLMRAGVATEAITSVGPCTRCAAERYFSRRAANGAVTGLQLSFIGFTE